MAHSRYLYRQSAHSKTHLSRQKMHPFPDTAIPHKSLQIIIVIYVHSHLMIKVISFFEFAATLCRPGNA